MPIYEFEPPPGVLRVVIPYPGQNAPLSLPPRRRKWRDPLTPEDEARIDRHFNAVYPWLCFIFLVWVFTHDWPATVATFSSRGLWGRFAVEALAVLL